MNRPIALLCALLLSWISLSSMGLAAELGQLRFRLSAERGERLQLTLSDEGSRGGLHSSSFAARDLQGLDPAALAASAARPVRFALIREAGRIDCTGSGGSGRAAGDCRFAADPAFASLLAARGIARPDERQAFGLTMVGATRALVDAIAAARYPRPSVDDLTALAALGVTPAYIDELAARGYRPERMADLVAFKALGVTPAYLDGLRSAGYDKLNAGEITQFKALGISPAYLVSLRSVGYERLTAGEVVQLKALGVTAAYIAGLQRLGQRLPVSKLIESKALGVTPDDVRALRENPRLSISADELIRLRLTRLLP